MIFYTKGYDNDKLKLNKTIFSLTFIRLLNRRSLVNSVGLLDVKPDFVSQVRHRNEI